MIRFCLDAISKRQIRNKKHSNPTKTSSKMCAGCFDFLRRKNNQKDDPNLSQLISEDMRSDNDPTFIHDDSNASVPSPAIFEENFLPCISEKSRRHWSFKISVENLINNQILPFKKILYKN